MLLFSTDAGFHYAGDGKVCLVTSIFQFCFFVVRGASQYIPSKKCSIWEVFYYKIFAVIFEDCLRYNTPVTTILQDIPDNVSILDFIGAKHDGGGDVTGTASVL